MTTPLKVHGVDISHHQSGDLSFAVAKRAGVQFVYHKATEGEGYVDRLYPKRRVEVGKAGLAFGAYHFARPAVGDAVREARHFVGTAQPKVGDLMPCLDIETDEGLSDRQLNEWALAFVNEVKRLTGFNCVVYTPFDLPSLGHCPLWVARYSNENTPPRIPKPWKQATIRQFSNGEYGVPKSVTGIGNVDLNTFGAGVTLGDIVTSSATKPPYAQPKSRGRMVDRVLKLMTKAKGTGERRRLLDKAKAALTKIKPS